MDSIKKFYDNYAKYWIKNSRPNVRASYLSLLGEVKEKQILDVGCGCGFDIKELSRRGAFGTGVDFSEVSIQQAKTQIGVNEKWNFVCTDFLSYNPGVQYDVVLFSMVVMHYPNLDIIFKKISSFLKDDGLLLLVTNNPYLVCADYKLPYPKEKENVSYVHHFVYEGTEMTVTKHLHSFADYINRGVDNGFPVVAIQELALYSEETSFFNPVPHPSIPNFLSVLYSKKQRK